jgi:hypothetical protein
MYGVDDTRMLVVPTGGLPDSWVTPLAACCNGLIIIIIIMLPIKP